MTTLNMSNPFDISGKNAIVTGGAMGIGFGIAKRFVWAGANVVIADIDAKAAEAAAAKLSGGPGKAVAIQVDISQPDTGDKMVKKCVDEFGSVDILVNNAGIFPNVPMMEMDRELFEKVLAINLTGLAYASKAAAAQMIAQKTGGRIINIASIDAIHPSAVGLAAYDASKGGVAMFNKAFALEVAPYGILVNAVAPGAIATEGVAKGMSGEGPEAERMRQVVNEMTKMIPLQRMGDPDEIATATLFLASPAASYMTGEMIVVDGGRLLK